MISDKWWPKAQKRLKNLQYPKCSKPKIPGLEWESRTNSSIAEFSLAKFHSVTAIWREKTVTSTTRLWIQSTPQWMRLRRGASLIEPGSGLSKLSLIKSKKQQLEYIWHWILDPTRCKTEFSMYQLVHNNITSQCTFSTVTTYGLNTWSKVTRWWVFKRLPATNQSTTFVSFVEDSRLPDMHAW